MRSVEGRLGVVLVVAAATAGLACTKRPLDPGSEPDTGVQPHDAAPSVGVPDAGATDHPRDAIADAQGREAIDEPPSDGDAPTDERTADARPDGDAGGAPDAGSDSGTRKPRALSLVLDGAPWYASQWTQGIAADALGRVYVQDGAAVYKVEGSTLGKYLTADEAAVNDFGDMDIGPDGRLYIVASWPTPGLGFGIVRSNQPHVAERWIDLSPTLTDVSKIAVIDDGKIGAISRTGFWTFTDAGGQMVYPMSALSSTDGCACQDLAAARSGVFLYQPGCNASPILRGQADGTGVGTLYTAGIGRPSEVSANNFTCVARDPSGGFYFIVQDTNDGAPRLYHVSEDGQGTSGLTWIETTPSFAEAKKQASSVFGFLFCSLATAPDSTVYFQTYAQLWKVAP